MSKRNRMTPFVARKSIYCFVAIFSFMMLGCATSEIRQKVGNVVANPMNLNYRFQFDEPSRREAADPVIEYFKGKYYLFASKSGGYWSSEDLCEWTYIPCKSIDNPIEAHNCFISFCKYNKWEYCTNDGSRNYERRKYFKPFKAVHLTHHF